MTSRIRWPGGKDFAFTIFDDTDWSTVENCREIYALLADLGLRTTKSVWPIGPTEPGENIYIAGSTCAEPEYLAWVQNLQRQGFEIALHNATCHSVPRADSLRALDTFRTFFGADPQALANHADCRDGIYAGAARLSGARRLAYNLATRFRSANYFEGHVENSPYFWGDACQARISYVRNFVFNEINCLKACPEMPYRDPLRPHVNQWFISADAANLESFFRMLTPANLERLAREGGASILYVHFGIFFPDGRVTDDFKTVLRRVAGMNGWFPTSSDLLDHIRRERGESTITTAQRARLEYRWLWDKLRHGAS